MECQQGFEFGSRCSNEDIPKRGAISKGKGSSSNYYVKRDMLVLRGVHHPDIGDNSKPDTEIAW